MGKTEKIKQEQPQFFHVCLKFYESAIGPMDKCPAEIILICYLMMITSALKVFLYQIILKS